jgi:hypothetical protein
MSLTMSGTIAYMLSHKYYVAGLAGVLAYVYFGHTKSGNRMIDDIYATPSESKMRVLTMLQIDDKTPHDDSTQRVSAFFGVSISLFALALLFAWGYLMPKL